MNLSTRLGEHSEFVDEIVTELENSSTTANFVDEIEVPMLHTKDEFIISLCTFGSEFAGNFDDDLLEILGNIEINLFICAICALTGKRRHVKLHHTYTGKLTNSTPAIVYTVQRIDVFCRLSPSRFVLFVIIPNWVAHGLRDTIAGGVLCLIIGILLFIEEIRGTGCCDNGEFSDLLYNIVSMIGTLIKDLHEKLPLIADFPIFSQALRWPPTIDAAPSLPAFPKCLYIVILVNATEYSFTETENEKCQAMSLGCEVSFSKDSLAH
ncbi:hypothetical protein HHK36_003161 [Tetracentron sinense]|uniref:Uncharacterized protein n=1 Tax=Tetracentron sinense TaxID=13715 RepID=A0A835DRU4_TETSI|nr:hypothetical protein HHK36_003161 [Tetracentron sinense]